MRKKRKIVSIGEKRDPSLVAIYDEPGLPRTFYFLDFYGKERCKESEKGGVERDRERERKKEEKDGERKRAICKCKSGVAILRYLYTPKPVFLKKNSKP